MTSGPWLGGLHVTRTEYGQTPVADLLCARCGYHRRVTGRASVEDYTRSNPISHHRAQCPALKKGTSA